MSFELLKITFAESKLPKFKEQKQKGFVTYGEKNDFPDTLLEFYKRSPKHGAIVKQKARFTAGSECVIEGNQAALKLIDFVNPYEGLHDFKAKLALDYEIFNGYCFEVHYNKLGQIAKFYHVDFSKIRTNDHRTYLYLQDWQKYKADEVRTYDRFNPDTAEPFSVQLYYYREYDAGLGVYPLPPYIHGLQYIEIDVEIANFHNNNIRNGFSNGTLVQLFKGEPTPEQARKFERKFKDRTTGTDNAGGLIIQFNDGNERPAEVNHIQPSDIDKQFLQLNETVNSEIFTAHNFPPILMGQKSDGQLGARNELIEAYELFHKSYVNSRQARLDASLEYVCDFVYPGVQISTQDSEYLGVDYVALYQVGLVSREEAREALGFQPVQVQAQFKEVCEFEKWNDDDLKVFAQFGQPESDFEPIKFNFAELSEKELAIMGAVNDNPKASVKEISTASRIAEDEVIKILRVLQDAGKIEWTNTAIKITDIGINDISDSGGTPRIELRYKYEKSPEALPLKTQSRPFCIEMQKMNRLYTRQDIDQMTAILGYDVWRRRGGWYTVPDSEPAIHLPHCRHEWKQVYVRRRNNG
jgi:hypothetical protein